MPDSADDLILKMQHIEAAARAEREAQSRGAWASKLKSAAQKLAAEAQHEVDAAELAQRIGEEKQAKARTPGMNPLEAAELLTSGRTEAGDARTRLIKARARLNFLLDQLDEADRAEYEALRASAMAEAHTQLADSGDDSSQPPKL